MLATDASALLAEEVDAVLTVRPLPPPPPQEGSTATTMRERNARMKGRLYMTQPV
jgi:hypothetical protein